MSKIKFYGPLAAALSFIIHKGNVKPTKEMLSVFRGLQIPEKELKEKYTVGKSFNLQGFTSTTLNREVAVGFAIGDEDPEKCPLLIEIKIKGGLQLFSLNSGELSAYPKEEEILLQDGIEYRVVHFEHINKKIKKNGKIKNKKLAYVILEK